MSEVEIRPDGAQYAGHTYAIVDGLSMPAPERKWFEEWRAGGIGCVNTTVSVWENATETLGLLGKWRSVLAQNADLVAQATSVAEIEAIRRSGRTAIVFGFQFMVFVVFFFVFFG